MASQIFISYSKKDKDFAWKLADDLVSAGHKVWIDRSLVVGEDWEQTIESKLAAANEVIVILSSNSISSKWVQHEGSIAYGLKKQMYPVLIETLPVEELPLWMSKFQYHSFIDVDYEAAFEGLNAVLTPPNPIQDLLEQQVNAYRQTRSLMGAAMLQVIEEARGTLQIGAAAEELIEKSRQTIQAEQQKELEQQRNLEKTRRQRTMVLTSGMIIALILSGFSFFLYRQAEDRATQAQSRQLAAISLSKLENNFNLAVLLSVEGIDKEDNFLSRDSLLNAVQYNPYLLRSLDRHTDWVYSVTFSPDGETLASGSADNTIRLWDVSATLNTSISTALNTGVHSGQPIGEPLSGHTGSVLSVAFSPECDSPPEGCRETLASGGDDGTIRLWDAHSGQPIGEPLTEHTETVSSVAFSPDGETLASGSWDDTIRLWDAHSGQPIGEPLSGHTAGVGRVAFSPDGETLASGSDDNTIRLWDISTVLNTGAHSGQQIGEPLSGHTDVVLSVAFSPDGKTLASGSRDDTIRLWDVGSGQQIGEPLTGHTWTVTSVAFSPDGETLASGSWDDTIRLWDVHSGQPIGEPLRGHTATVYSVAFSPDGETLASGSWDRTIRLWDVETGQPIGEPLRGHTRSVYSVAFSPDGETLASGSADGTIWLWDMSIEGWIGKACERVSRNLTETEWNIYFPGECYRVTCTQYPAEFVDERPFCQ